MIKRNAGKITGKEVMRETSSSQSQNHPLQKNTNNKEKYKIKCNKNKYDGKTGENGNTM